MKIRDFEILGLMRPRYEELLTEDALNFITALHMSFNEIRKAILDRRIRIQQKIDAGEFPEFTTVTRPIRENRIWQTAEIPPDLQKRWVEITGPAGDRKMVINALNSGADIYMADFEDAQSPTWEGLMDGQINLYDAVRRTITFDHPQKGKIGLHEKTATLMVRPRGWHLLEKHALPFESKPISASLFDFGLFFYHNAQELVSRGSAPYFYLPKLENRLEAQLWDDVFTLSEKVIGLPHGTIRATVLIENVLAAFEAEEILWTLRNHSAGLNVGRWDYIASFGKKFRNHPQFVLPDRGTITMDKHFMKSYVDYVIHVCHKRGAHAIGGMAAQIPISWDAEANEQALNKVRADKEREVKAGHDGTWVAHPALVSVASGVFQNYLEDKHNQIEVKREDVKVTAEDLLTVPHGKITEEGLRENINAFIKYIAGWLRGTGAVAIAYYTKEGKLLSYLMEDAATAEIARTELWKWAREKPSLDDGREVNIKLILELIIEELAKIRAELGDKKFQDDKYREAETLLTQIICDPDFPEYLTLSAYEILLRLESAPKGEN